jgi:hypothetical protein
MKREKKGKGGCRGVRRGCTDTKRGGLCTKYGAMAKCSRLACGHSQLSKGVGPCPPRHESPRRVKHRLVVHESCIRRRNPRGWRRGRTLQCGRVHM